MLLPYEWKGHSVQIDESILLETALLGSWMGLKLVAFWVLNLMEFGRSFLEVGR